MSQPSTRLSYAEIATPLEMHADCLAVRALPAVAAASAAAGAPSLEYADYRTDLKPQIEISEAAQRLANALSLHLD